MWNVRRADAARLQLARLATSALDVEDVQASAIEIVRRVVPFDAACWATVDPDTMMFTGSMTLEFEPGPALEQRFAEIESSGADPNSFRHLAAQPRSIARLSDAGPAAMEASERLKDIWGPLGLRHEVRAVFSVANRCWAVGGMLRNGDSADFSVEEVDFLSAVSPTIATATRSALLRRPQPTTSDLQGPAVLILDPFGAARSVTPAAQDLLDQSVQLGSRTGRFALTSLVAAVQHGTASARARLHDDRFGWLVLLASPLSGADHKGDVVVTIAPAATRDLTALLLDAHGLSAREREVVHAVHAGLSTTEIARALFISTNTVQDHLKSVFDKMGVRSRRELTAYVNGTQIV